MPTSASGSQAWPHRRSSVVLRRVRWPLPGGLAALFLPAPSPNTRSCSTTHWVRTKFAAVISVKSGYSASATGNQSRLGTVNTFCMHTTQVHISALEYGPYVPNLPMYRSYKSSGPVCWSSSLLHHIMLHHIMLHHIMRGQVLFCETDFMVLRKLQDHDLSTCQENVIKVIPRTEGAMS